MAFISDEVFDQGLDYADTNGTGQFKQQVG